jgi:gamma-glutamyl:cysteine ligase YbdK (ATP-grasp superfamily)
LKGKLVDPISGRTRSIAEDILDTVAAIMPHGNQLGSGDALSKLAAGVRAGLEEAQWLRERRGPSGSMSDVVRAAADRWALGR